DTPVAEGSELLRMKSFDLDQQVTELSGRAQGIETRLVSLRGQHRDLTPAERAEINGQIGELEIERRTIADQIATLSKMRELLTLKSPIDGRIITGKDQIEQLGKRPVTRGQMLLE